MKAQTNISKRSLSSVPANAALTRFAALLHGGGVAVHGVVATARGRSSGCSGVNPCDTSFGRAAYSLPKRLVFGNLSELGLDLLFPRSSALVNVGTKANNPAFC